MYFRTTIYLLVPVVHYLSSSVRKINTDFIQTSCPTFYKGHHYESYVFFDDQLLYVIEGNYIKYRSYHIISLIRHIVIIIFTDCRRLKVLGCVGLRFHNVRTKFHHNPSDGSGVKSLGRTDRQTWSALYTSMLCLVTWRSVKQERWNTQSSFPEHYRLSNGT